MRGPHTLQFIYRWQSISCLASGTFLRLMSVNKRRGKSITSPEAIVLREEAEEEAEKETLLCG